MREFLVPPPGTLGLLQQHGILEASQRLGTLAVGSDRADELRGLVDSVSELPKEDDLDGYGLSGVDWEWGFGSRLVRRDHVLEVRSFHSYSRFLLPDAEPPKEEARQPVFSGRFVHQALDYDSSRVLVLRFGMDRDMGGYYRNFMLISVKVFVPGPWVEFLKAVAKVDEPGGGKGERDDPSHRHR